MTLTIVVLLLLVLATMLVIPGFMAVIKPLLSTMAILKSLLDQIIFLSVALSGSTLAIICC